MAVQPCMGWIPIKKKKLARFCRLDLGTTSATEIFYGELRKKLHNTPGALSIHDDIIVGGKDTDDYVQASK